MLALQSEKKTSTVLGNAPGTAQGGATLIFFFIHVVNDMLLLSLLIMHFFSSSRWKECFRFDSNVMPWQDLSQLPAVAFVDTF